MLCHWGTTAGQTHTLRIHCTYCKGGTEMPQLHSGLSGCHNSVAERWRLKPSVLASIPASWPVSLYSILPQPFISSVKRCFMGGDYWQGLTCTSVTSHNVLSAILIWHIFVPSIKMVDTQQRSLIGQSQSSETVLHSRLFGLWWKTCFVSWVNKKWSYNSTREEFCMWEIRFP